MHYYRWRRGVPIDLPKRMPGGNCTVVGCEKKILAKGLCSMHYSRLRRHGDVDAACQPRPTGMELFWSKVQRTEGCWLWTGRKANGYGDFGKKRAHRVAYEALVGLIPKGLVLDHLCRNPPCVNPEHLEPAASRVNILRGVGPAAKHAVATHCIHGHPFDEENTYRKKGTHHRDCRTCNRERAARNRAAAKHI